MGGKVEKKTEIVHQAPVLISIPDAERLTARRAALGGGISRDGFNQSVRDLTGVDSYSVEVKKDADQKHA